MLKYEQEQERIRVAEQNRLAEIARKEQEAETARLVAEQKRLYDIAQAEAKKLADIAAEKAAAQKKIDDAEYARLKKEGDKKAAEEARKAAKLAAEAAELKAKQDKQDALDRAEAARLEAIAVKKDAELSPATVILEKTHQGVTRRKVYKYRLTAKDGRKFLKADLTASVRLGIKDLGVLPAHLFVLSPVLLNSYVDEQGEAAAIPGVLEVKSEMV